MPSSAVRKFTDPDDYAAIRAGTVEFGVTGRGDFNTKLIRIDLQPLGGFVDMTQAAFHRIAPLLKATLVAAVLSTASCSGLNTPTAQSIQGLTPSGSVTLTETFAAGYGGGRGTLNFNGGTYPFTLVGAVVGPGGAERVTASGEVYKLANLEDFGGRYTQASGAAGLSRGGAGELWLQNNAGVIMHLYSQTQGVLLSLGKEEIIIRLNAS